MVVSYIEDSETITITFYNFMEVARMQRTYDSWKKSECLCKSGERVARLNGCRHLQVGGGVMSALERGSVLGVRSGEVLFRVVLSAVRMLVCGCACEVGLKCGMKSTYKIWKDVAECDMRNDV